MNHTVKIVVDIICLIVVIFGGGWLLIRSLKACEEPKKIIFKWFITALLVGGEIFLARRIAHYIHEGGPAENIVPAFALVISVAACSIVVAMIWGTHIGNIAARPFTSLFDGGNEPPEPKPQYSAVITKRKLGKALEAIVAVREQLAKFPNDYEGTMLLASIQAEDMKDLPSAEMTLNHFCDWEKAPPKQVAAALSQMADWYLKLSQDSYSAGVCLGKIIQKYPDTEMALVAKQRIAHLGGVEKILLAAHDRPAVAVREGIQSAGLRDTIHNLVVPAEVNPAELAQTYVKHLAQHPQDTEAREKLAVIYAEHYKRLDLAAIELGQLINEPNHPPKRVAHWLNLLADLQVHGGADYETVRPTLEQIVKRFPDLPIANLAQSRLARLKLEIKGQKEKTPGVKLGVYEQNIGLKYGPAYGSKD